MKPGKFLGYSFSRVVKSNAYRILFLGAVLSVALPLLFLTATGSMLNTAREKKKDIYGEFTDVYYGDKESLDGLLKDEEKEKIKRCGQIVSVDAVWWAKGEKTETLKKQGGIPSLADVWEQRKTDSVGFLGEEETDGLLAAGYVDREAESLGRLTLSEGKWPEAGQVVLTETLRKELEEVSGDRDISPGKPVEIGGGSYLVSGILKDYGMLWISGINQTKGDRLLPEIFFSDKDFRSFSEKISGQEKERGRLSERVLMELSGTFSHEIYENDYRMIQNIPIREERFSIPPFLLTLVYLCSALLLIQILLLGLDRFTDRMRLYRILGVTRNRIPALFYLDLFWVFVLAVPAGVFLGVGGAYLICLFGERFFEGRILFQADAGQILGVIFLTGGILGAAGIGPAIRLFRVGLQERRRPGGRRKKYRLSWIFLNLLIFCVFCLYGVSRCYLKADESLNLSMPLYGKMATDYDYEFLANTISNDTSYLDEDGNYVGMSVMEADDVFTVYNEPYLGIEEEDLRRLEAAEGVRRVSAYKACNQLKLPMDRKDPYQQAMEDEIYSVDVGGYRDLAAEYFDLEESYVDTKLQGYPEEELLNLEPYVEEGRIDPEKIRSGEEVVLMVPDIQVKREEYDDGSGGKGIMTWMEYLEKGTYKGKEGQYSNRYYKVGDTVTLTRLYSENKGLRGFIKENTMKKEVKRQDITFKIGAIIRCRAGWFEDNPMPDPLISFLCFNETFDAVGLSSTYTRVRVYGREDRGRDALRQTVYRMKNKLPEMSLDNRYSFMEEYRQYHMLLTVLGGILTGLSALLGAGMLLSQLLMRIREERRYTGLYQVAGCTGRMLFGKLVRPFIPGVFVMWAFSMGAVRIISERYYGLEGYWSAGRMAACLGAAVLVTGGILRICSRVFFKESISSLIREED